MALLVYKFSDYEHTAEREQYRSLCKQLNAFYSTRDEICLFVANYNIYDCELDGILIKQDAIMCIEFKNYGGIVTAVENGHWKLSDGTIIKGGSRKTVYQQANLNHVAIKRGFKDGDILPSNAIKNVAALVVFHQPIELENHLSSKTQSWLHVCDERTFIEKVQDITSKSTDLSKEDMLSLISKMALAEEYLDKDYSTMDFITNHLDSMDSEQSTSGTDDSNDQSVEDDQTITTPEPVNQILDEERQGLYDFVNNILHTLFSDLECTINIFYSQDAANLFAPYGIAFSKKFLITVESIGIGNYCQKLSKFINHPVRAIKPELIFWEDGEILSEDSPVTNKEKEPEGSLQSKEVPVIPNTKSNANISFRKSKTILPHWIDRYLYNTCSAQYAPEHERFEYNLDLSEEEIKVYLGTYFPRSYAEIFCVFDNLLSNSSYINEINRLEAINILDVGCGTGGELFGLLTALTKHIAESKIINIYVCDGNEAALDVLEDLCKVAQKNTHHKLNITIIKRIFALKTKLDIKDLDKFRYEMILCNKVICELISHNVITDKAYHKVAKSLAPLLSEVGILTILDVTTKDERSGHFYPQLMNIELNKYVAENSEIVTLLPHSCGIHRLCRDACFMQQTFFISHSHKTNDESRVCYRMLCKDVLKDKIVSSLSDDASYIIHPIKYSQGDNSATCKYLTGNKIIDSFNINI